jgi:15-cis-phytoene desaturase
MRKDTKSVTIIGGGLAGLATAVSLSSAGFRVTLLEKNSHLGGRASNTIDSKMKDAIPIGPHIFVKSYKNFHKFLETIGASEAIVWERKLFLELIYNGRHFQFRMSDLPTSLFSLSRLLRYPFTGIADKLSNIVFALGIFLASRESLEKLDDRTAYEYLLSCGVSQNSIDRIWRFFVMSMLNVPIEECSAAEFCLLVKYWAKLKNREIGFAKIGLGDIYTKQASDYITARGGTILKDTKVSEIVFTNSGIGHLVTEENGSKNKIVSDIYVSTLNPTELREILPVKESPGDFFKCLDLFEGVPYISVNLWFDKKITHKKFWALLNDSETPRHLNTDFYDLSNIYKTRRDTSYIASNIIYSKTFEHLSDSEIIRRTVEELREVFPDLAAQVTHSHIHRIPYVIYAPYPGMRKYKLPNITPISNFYLCGDWTNRHMTQCMEAAVQSGFECAEIIKSRAS